MLEQAPREPGAPPPPAGGGQLPKFTFDAKRWSPADRISGAATLVLLVSLFLPWFGVTFFGLSATADGLAAHGYLYVVLIICLAMLAYLVAVAGWRELPFALPGSHEQPLLIGSVVNLVLVFFGFVFKPGGSIVGWRFGAFLGLIAAIAAVVPLALPMVRSGKAAHR